MPLEAPGLHAWQACQKLYDIWTCGIATAIEKGKDTMDALFEKLDRLSSPLGSLLDVALNRLAPHVTASALVCGNNYLCYVTCSGKCTYGQVEYLHYSNSSSCKTITGSCPNGCRCVA